jgi:hypothetical protein
MSSLECSICLEEFGDNDKSEKAPKVLSCGHTFCCKCIKQKLVKANNQIICSFDMKKDNRAFEEIPFNRAIYDLVEEKKQKNIKIQVKNDEKYDILFNIGMIGCQSAGKTSLSKCYQDNKPLPIIPYEPTILLDHYSRIININGKKAKVLIWDTAGLERFNSIADLHSATSDRAEGPIQQFRQVQLPQPGVHPGSD